MEDIKYITTLSNNSNVEATGQRNLFFSGLFRKYCNRRGLTASDIDLVVYDYEKKIVHLFEFKDAKMRCINKGQDAVINIIKKALYLLCQVEGYQMNFTKLERIADKYYINGLECELQDIISKIQVI